MHHKRYANADALPIRLSMVRIFVIIGMLLTAKFKKKRQRVAHLFRYPVNRLFCAQRGDAYNKVAPRIERLKVRYNDSCYKAYANRGYESSSSGLEVISGHEQDSRESAQECYGRRINNLVDVLKKLGHRVEVHRKLILGRRWQETNGTSLIW